MPPFRNVSHRQHEKSSSIKTWTEEEFNHFFDVTLPTLARNLTVKVEPPNPQVYDTTQGSSESYPSSPSSCSPSTPSDIAPSSASPNPNSRKARRENPDYIPRPRNAFIIFRSHYVNTHPNTGKEPQNSVSKTVGAIWQGMSSAERAPFCEQACREKDLHEAMYPNYVFAPVRKTPKDAEKEKVTRKRKPKKTPAIVTSFYETSSEFSSPASSVQLSLQPSSYTHDEFVPTSAIPPIDLSPRGDYNYSPQIPDLGSPNNFSPYEHQPHYLPEEGCFDQFQLSPQAHDQSQAQEPILSPLPLPHPSIVADESSLFPFQSPLPCSPSESKPLDTYPSVDYVDTFYQHQQQESSAYELHSYSYLFEDQTSQDAGSHFDHDLPVTVDREDSIKNLRLTSLLSGFDNGLGFSAINDNEAMHMPSTMEPLEEMHYLF